MPSTKELTLNLTDLIEQAVGKDFRQLLGDKDGYRIDILQDDQPRSWIRLTSISRLTLHVTGWNDTPKETTDAV